MKVKLTVVLIALLLASHTAGAQSLNDLLRFFGFGTTEKSEQSAESASVPLLTSHGLLGEWHYSEPALRYDGEEVMGAIGVKAVESMLPSMYARAGLTAGSTLTFALPDEARGRLGDYRLTGRYEFTPSDGKISVSALVGGVEGLLHGEASLDESGVLTLLFDASEAAAIVERVSPAVSSNEKFRTMKSVLDLCPGVMMGCRLTR